MELKLGKNKRLVIEEVKENNLELSYVKRNLFEKASSEVQKEYLILLRNIKHS